MTSDLNPAWNRFSQEDESFDGSFLPHSAKARYRTLTSFGDKDRVYLRDLIEVGLVDEGWLDRLPPLLRNRLEDLLANPEG